MKKQIDISIIIVSWNVAELLDDCLKSIEKSHTILVGSMESHRESGQPKDWPTVEVVVVDSNSSDHTMQILKKYPWVISLPQAENVGFARGTNIGLAISRGALLMLLNPDTEVFTDTLSCLKKYLDTHMRVGLVGPQTLNTDGSVQPTKRGFPSFSTSLFSLSKNSPRQEGRGVPSYVSDYYYQHNLHPDSTGEVDWLQGSAIMAKRETYEQIGGLDERFYIFHDDVDWCKRAWNAGWKVVYVGSTKLFHHQGKSTSQSGSGDIASYWETTRVLYFKKHHGYAYGTLQAFLLFSNKHMHFIVTILQKIAWQMDASK